MNSSLVSLFLCAFCSSIVILHHFPAHLFSLAPAKETQEIQLDEKALLCLFCVRPPQFTCLVDLAPLHHMLSLQLTLALFFFGRNGADVGLQAAALATLGLLRLRRRCERTTA